MSAIAVSAGESVVFVMFLSMGTPSLLIHSQAARVHCYPKDASDVHLSGAGLLSRYTMSPGASAYFCKQCGTHLVVALDEPSAESASQSASEALGHSLNIVAVNIRELHGIDMDMLRINKHDARGQAPIYQV